jgi:hypothetical protein
MSTVTVILTEGYSDWEIAVLCGLGRAFFNAEIRFTSPGRWSAELGRGPAHR